GIAAAVVGRKARECRGAPRRGPKMPRGEAGATPLEFTRVCWGLGARYRALAGARARYRALAGARARSVAAPIANREPQKSTGGGRKCSQLFSVEHEGGGGAHQISLRQAEVLAEYERGGAASFVVEVSGIQDGDIDALVTAARAIAGVNSAEAPYNGVDLALGGDISFVVFQNDQQREYLGARTSVVGVDRSFDPSRDYYVNFHRLNPQAPQSVLGIPLLPVLGTMRSTTPQEILVPSSVTDYVGVRPGAQASIELRYTGVIPPIVRRFEGAQLIGTFEVVGPDQGRFDPFWQLELRGQEALTVH